MSFFRLILRNITYHKRMHGGLLLGVALAGSILTGALVVGDSVEATLESIASGRLGGVAYALDRANQPFNEGLADEMRKRAPGMEASAVLRLRGTVGLPPERRGTGNQLNRAQVLGVDGSFFALAERPWGLALKPQEIAVNEKTAGALGVGVGDDVVLRVLRQARMPLDAPLSSRADAVWSSAFVSVAAVLSEEQLGDFNLSATQITPYNVFADRAWLQGVADAAGIANLVVAGGEVGEGDAQRAVEGAWDLEDVGLRLRAHKSGVIQLESDSVFVEAGAVEAAKRIEGSRATLTYLVNSISRGGRMTPYSFVEAGACPAEMPAGHVVINEWAARELDAKAGDEVDVAYMKLRANNTFVEETRSFRVHSVVPMSGLEMERELAPQFPGLSDVENCSDWDIGLPMDEERLKDKANETYWRTYGQTPKALFTLEDGQAMWGNLFGEVTAIRFDGEDVAGLGARLREGISGDAIGLKLMEVRERARAAVDESIDFGGLFLGMSFFLIVSSLILLALLYVFGLQHRAEEIGTLSSLGFSAGRIRAIFLAESAATTVLGGVVGAAGGAAYARVLLAVMARLWPAAVAGTAVEFHADAGTLAAGGLIAVACAVGVIAVTLWRALRFSPRQLFGGDFSAAAVARGGGRLGYILPTAALLPAIGIGVDVWVSRPASCAGHFFGVGALLLVALLGYGHWWMSRMSSRESLVRPRLWKLGVANVLRRRGRTLSVAGLTACGCFLVFAVSSMEENVVRDAEDRGSGTGGFGVFAETTIPLLGSPAEVGGMLGLNAVPLRVRDGDDAGCLNLNRAQQPRMFGVDAKRLSELGAFVREGDVWESLEGEADGEVSAVVGDLDTAMWGLKKRVGDTLAYRDEGGRDVVLRIVGVLPMRLSVFQGALLVSEESFSRLFSSEPGYRAFLVDAGGEKAGAAAVRLNRQMEEYGMEALPAVDRLREFSAVESTYLRMFLVLGGLGMALGAGGIGVVVLRNCFERRQEFAVLHASGFERGTVLWMLLAENGAVVGAGIVIGAVSALVSIVPVVFYSETVVAAGMQLAVLAVVVVANGVAVVAASVLGLPKRPTEWLREE